MSRGPGVLQRRVLETLAEYQRLGASLQWNAEPSAARRWMFQSEGIAAYEVGRRVPVWMLIRDLGCTRSDLSRAEETGRARACPSLQHGNEHHRTTRAGRLGFAGWLCNCKYVGLSREGDAWVKRQQKQTAEVGTYQPMPVWAPQ